MSSTNSSPLSSSESARERAVRKLVEQRAGHEWCLFLDRDGVINKQLVGNYVRKWDDFQWLPFARRGLKALRSWAPRLVIVTNQQGIGKGLMSGDDLEVIHRNLRSELAAEGVAIDAVCACTHLVSAGCRCRKPQPGLVLDWLEQHPALDGSLSIVVGDSDSDINLAREVSITTGGCASVRVGGYPSAESVADATFDSLWEFASTVERVRLNSLG